MKCIECRTPMKSRKENYRYDFCGLKHITLIGILVSRCPACPNVEISIPRVVDLHRRIARALIEKATRLTGEEIRFLRRSLGWTGSEFAKHMGVADETVSRWENDAAPIGPQADRLLRMVIAQWRLTTRYRPERLTSINPKRAAITRLELEARDERWELRSA